MTARVIIALAFLVGAFGCGSSPTEPTAPPQGAMAGRWSVFLTFTGYERPSGTTADDWRTITCEGGVTMVLADNAGVLAGGFTEGNLSCRIDGTQILVPWASPITGQRDKSAIFMDDGYCQYPGTQIGPSLARGRIECDFDSGSTELRAVGTWEATQ